MYRGRRYRPPVNRPSAPAAVLGGAFAFGYSFLALILVAQVQPALRLELGIGVDRMALINGGTFLAAAVGGFLAGRLLDRGRRDLALLLGALLPAAGLGLAAYATGESTFAACRWLTGLGVGGGWGVAHASVAAAVPEGRRLLAAGFVQAAAPLGNVAAVLLGIGLDRGLGWRGVLGLGAALGLGGLLLPRLFRDAPEPAPRSVSSSRSVAVPGVRREVRSGFDTGLDSDIRSTTEPSGGRRAAIVLFAMLALHMGAFWLFYAWIPEWLERDAGRPRDFVRTVQLALCAGFLGGDLLFPALARRIGVKPAFVGASLAFGAGVALTPQIADLALQSPAAHLAFVATGLAAGLWSAFGPFYATHVAPAVRGQVASTSYQLARAGQLAMQPMVPLLRDAGGFAAVFAAAALCSALGGLLVLFLPQSLRARPLTAP